MIEMANITVQPIVLCGGSGRRLWPLSRSGFPKQFISLNAEVSLFQQTVLRLRGLGTTSTKSLEPIFVTGEEHQFLVAEQLQELGLLQTVTLLEPCSRDTAPALTIAALAAIDLSSDPVLVVSPSDHLISDNVAFNEAVQSAVEEALKETIVLFGINPDNPESGFGYIKAQTELTNSVFDAIEFIEKPDIETAKSYLMRGGYYWNSGLLILKASVWLKAINRFRPDIYKHAELAWATKKIDGSVIHPGKTEFAAMPRDSIDCAVIERCAGSGFQLKMIMLNAGWSDVGSWKAVWQHMAKDDMGNASCGDALFDECSNVLIYSTSRLVGVMGAKELAVIETPDSILVVDMNRTQGVKQFTRLLLQKSREELMSHRKVFRPWGWYEIIEEGQGFKVKRIQVNENSSLSLQRHLHRAESWVVLKGTAEVTLDDKKINMKVGESVFILAGTAHRLANTTSLPLIILEVQSGAYLGEDDIVRIDDQFGRCK